MTARDLKIEAKNNNLKLKEIRSKKNLTQKELAKLVGVKQRDVSRWETGRVTPRIRTLYTIARVLEVELDDLVNFL